MKPTQASCILMFWNYSSALQRCKCPICSRLISKLIPEASLSLRREEDVVQVLKKVQGYNRLFVGGAHGFIMKTYTDPLVDFGSGALLIYETSLDDDPVHNYNTRIFGSVVPWEFSSRLAMEMVNYKGEAKQSY
ncbi:hypothetical protein CsSME_00048352 [Camellia sinensis var. sinensis]